MPEEFTVTKVKFAGEKPNPHGGTLYKFYVRLRQETGATEGAPFTDDVYWQRKSRDLNEGEQVYGHIEQGEYGPRFKTDQRPDGGNFKSPDYQRAPDNWNPVAPQGSRTGGFPKDEQRWSIERQVAAKCAAEVLKGQPQADLSADVIDHLVNAFHTAILGPPISADVGSGQAAHGASPNSPSVAEDAADLSAETQGVEAGGGGNQSSLEEPPAEASPAQKGTLTKLFHEAGLSREAMKAVVLFRCGSEKATKQGASQLITDLQDGATHDALLAEIYDASRAGNPLAKRAAALIPSQTPADMEGLPELDPEDRAKYGAPL